VPSTSAIEVALATRTGLDCTVTADAANRVLVATCREFPARVEIHLAESKMELEQPMAQSAYFFHELEQALVELGGWRCDFGGRKKPGGDVARTPVRWRDRSGRERFIDAHPVLAGLLWWPLVIASSVAERFRRMP
jgi:hypothetical protein